MKSAYELAMERLAATDGESKPLSDELKGKLAQIDEKYRAKIAEREIFLQPKIAAALSSGKRREAEDLRKQMVNERAALEEQREADKENLRKHAN